jgi:hypothetical protein
MPYIPRHPLAARQKEMRERLLKLKQKRRRDNLLIYRKKQNRERLLKKRLQEGRLKEAARLARLLEPAPTPTAPRRRCICGGCRVCKIREKRRKLSQSWERFLVAHPDLVPLDHDLDDVYWSDILGRHLYWDPRWFKSPKAGHLPYNPFHN